MQSNSDLLAYMKQLAKRDYRLYMDTKLLAKDVSALKTKVGANPGGREIAVALTKLEEAEMWLERSLEPVGFKIDEEQIDIS